MSSCNNSISHHSCNIMSTLPHFLFLPEVIRHVAQCSFKSNSVTVNAVAEHEYGCFLKLVFPSRRALRSPSAGRAAGPRTALEPALPSESVSLWCKKQFDSFVVLCLLLNAQRHKLNKLLFWRWSMKHLSISRVRNLVYIGSVRNGK